MSSDSAYQESIEETFMSILRGIGQKLDAAHGIVTAIVEWAMDEPDTGQAIFDEAAHFAGEFRNRDWAAAATSFIESPETQERFDAALAFFQEGHYKGVLGWAATHFESPDPPAWFDTMLEFVEEVQVQEWLDGVAEYVEEAGGPGWLSTAARWVSAWTGRNAGKALTVPEDWAQDATPAPVAAPALAEAAPPAAAAVTTPPADASPHPLDMPTAEQGVTLAALDSGRWRRVEPGSDSVSSRGDGTSSSDAVGLAELHSRDWITTVGGLTVAGRHALGRWLTASS